MPKVSTFKRFFGQKSPTSSRPSSPTSLDGNTNALQTNASREEKKLLEDEEFIQRMILEFGNTTSNEKRKYEKQLKNIRQRLQEIERGLIYKAPGGKRTRKQTRKNRRMTKRRR